MKTDPHEISSVAPPSEPTILDQIRSDHELIDRLKITTQELEALSKCALLGTLTCKQDMLFILRQIRESGDPEEATKILHPQPEREEDPVPHLARRTIRILRGSYRTGAVVKDRLASNDHQGSALCSGCWCCLPA